MLSNGKCTFYENSCSHSIDLNILFFFSVAVPFEIVFFVSRKYGIREDYQYSEILALCRFCCCLFWPSAGHPCIADQSPDFRARLKEAAGGDENAVNEFQPVPPAQFLKYFSL